MSMPVQNQLGLYVIKSARSCQRLPGETLKINAQKECRILLDSVPGRNIARTRMPQEASSMRFLPVFACIWETLGYNIPFHEQEQGARL